MGTHNADRETRRKSVERQAREKLDGLAKPPGSLGRLEDLAIRVCSASETLEPATRPRTLVIFAADHGSVASGVTQWPQDVSRAIAATIAGGKAGSSILADASGTAVRIVDVGLATAPLPPSDRLRIRRVAAGTRDMALEPAMTRAQFDTALAIGRETAGAEIDAGAKLLIAGEVGMGNTTAAAALTALLCGTDPAAMVGSGAGADMKVMNAKRAATRAAVARARAMADTLDSISSVCGFEIAAMAGFYLEATGRGVPVILDGAPSGAAALIAHTIDESCVSGMIAAHLSPEPSHASALARLGLSPFLEFGMRLGEGSGALALLPLIDLSVEMLTKMAPLAEALEMGRA